MLRPCPPGLAIPPQTVCKDRYDLTYVLAEMIGELSNSHTYVGGGDYPDLHPVNVGLLGVDFETDAQNRLYRFNINGLWMHVFGSLRAQCLCGEFFLSLCASVVQV